MGTTSRNGPQPKQSTRGRVLVLDDDADCAELVVRWLGARELHVRAAYDTESALAEARAHDPHVVILDLHLRGSAGGGHAVGVRIREDSARAVQLVVLTGDDRLDAQRRSEALGFAAHLVKPARIEDLARLVRMLVERARRPGSSSETPIVSP